MLRGSRSLGMHVRFAASLHSPRVASRRNAPSLTSYPADSENCVPSGCTLTSRLSRAPRGSCTLRMRPHYEALPQAPRVAYRRNAPSLRRSSACSEGRVPSKCALILRLSHMLRGDPQTPPSLRGSPACAVSRVPSACTFGLMLSRRPRGSRTRGMRSHFEAIPHFPMVAYRRDAPSL